MSHKVHPKSYRLREINDWDSRWLTKKRTPEFLEKDFRIRIFLEKKLKEGGISKIEIEHFPRKINVIISTLRPGLIIGRGGEGVEKLKQELEKKIFPKNTFSHNEKKTMIKLDIKEVRDPWSTSSLVAQWVAQRLEKRLPYRRVIKQSLDKIMSHKEIKGGRIEISGRLNGVEIARREWVAAGELPRQTIRADIDYSFYEAVCSYGVIGIKVWIYKGEKF